MTLITSAAVSARPPLAPPSTSAPITRLWHVLLGVPEHAEREALAGQLDRLDQVVLDRAAGDHQALAELVDPLVMVRLDPDPLAPRRPARRAMPGASAHLVVAEGPRRCARWLVVADELRQVLVERAAAGDVEHLHPAADAEQRHVALERAPRQRELEAVALGPGALRLGVRLGAVAGRVDVGAAGEDQPVEQVEQPVGIGLGGVVGRQQQRQRPPARCTARG